MKPDHRIINTITFIALVMITYGFVDAIIDLLAQ
jgi:hypothetical protein